MAIAALPEDWWGIGLRVFWGVSPVEGVSREDDISLMSLLKHCSLVCLGLLAMVSVVAAEADKSAPLTLEQVDRAQDLYLDSIQNRIVEVSENPSKAGFSNLWHHISHAKSSDKSPFAPGFQYYHVAASSMSVKTAPRKSSAERQAQQDIDNAFARSLKFVLDAHKAHESGNERTFVSRLTSASKEVSKVGAELDALRKRRSTQGVASKGQLSSVGATKPQNGAAPARK